MKHLSVLFSFLIMLLSSNAHATLNLNVKIGKMVGNQLVEINKTISADYDKEIIIGSDNLKNKIVLNLKKFTDILVNGKKINPVQVDMKIVNDMQKIIGRTQTVTSFYNRTAEFSVRSASNVSGVDDLNVTLDFEEN